jgi:N-methylhydantoinase A/oxoprolinase/acetone carboxylase beta subunit
MHEDFRLGIDAGGTYTDVVVLDFATGKLVCSRKALTTPHDPSEGIRNALAGVDANLLTRVNIVSLATTFATNAIVEDRGAEAGLILVGYEAPPPDIPRTTRVLMVDGGHDVSGEEMKPLDLPAIKESLPAFLEGLDAVAITGFFSVRNPEHEDRLAQLVRDYALPVVQGHGLSMRLDAVKRATTAWWNARLIPLISKLIHATMSVLVESNIRAPLMVVRGDGTLMSAQAALDRPVDTLLSGPAASILGAKYLSGIEDALIVDIGGTTTDMAALKGGRVAIDPQGATVGKWKTHVEAAKVRTIGMGGDSVISMNGNRQIIVGPRRVLPICALAERHPEIVKTLEAILRHATPAPYRNFAPCSFFLKPEFEQSTCPLPSCLDQGPVSEFLLQEGISNISATWELEHLEKQGVICRSSLTPTDVRVARGEFSMGNMRAAQLGLAVFARCLGVDVTSAAEAIEESIRKTICFEAVNYVDERSAEPLSRLTDKWFHQPASDGPEVGVDLQLRLTAPVIGLGAPAGACLPAAFRSLHTECILPEGYEVSVAVGAVVGVVDFTISGKIRPEDSGRFILHTSAGRMTCDTVDEAIELGSRVLDKLARERMRLNNVPEPLLDFSVKEKMVKAGSEDIFIEADLRLRATGRPNVWEQERGQLTQGA